MTDQPAPRIGSLLVADVPIATPGAYEFKFRVVGTWDVCNFGLHDNMLFGDNFACTTTTPGNTVRFEMNLATGRGRSGGSCRGCPSRSRNRGRGEVGDRPIHLSQAR